MIKHVDRNTLCCEAIVRRMPNGELLLVCQEDDIWEPAPLNRVYCFHSTDDGNTWGNKHLLCEENGEATYDTELNVVDGKVYCYITYHNGSFLNFRHRIMVSEDNGYTWKDNGAVLLDGFTFIRGLIETHDGTFLLPYQNYECSKEKDLELQKDPTKKIWHCGANYVKNGVLISYDRGKTYIKGNDALLPINTEEKGFIWVWSEPTIVELSDGTISMLMRFDRRGYLYRSDSKDQGLTWSKPYKTDIPNPSNKPKLIKLADGRIALINTPNEKIGMPNRCPLELWISDDDMKSFSYKKLLTDYPGWISYPDGFIEGNTLYLAYEFNRHDIYFIKVEI